MISTITNVNILVSLLKDYNVQHIVMAPGASDIPLIHLIEKDKFFSCYSVVDERSLVYYAIGISQQLGKPVACICTSGTAVSNFLPGMTEAFYQDVPIIAITCDKNQHFQDQIETQKIKQDSIFKDVCKKIVDLPVVSNIEENWLCERLVNEALIAMSHHGLGPVQINIPVIGDIASFKDADLPSCKKIDFFESCSSYKFMDYINNRINSFKKIMVLVGQNVDFSDKLLKNLEIFCKHYNAIIAADHIANIKCYGSINTYPVTELEKCISNELLPDLVISLGNNIASYDLKYILRQNKNLEHWQIDEAGRIRDVFQHLTAVFECSPLEFFESILNNPKKECKNTYYSCWKQEREKIKIDDIDYSSLLIVKEISNIIPDNSILHLAILNSTRLMQFFDLPYTVKTYSNFGALGIDGCLSTFMGQAISTDNFAFCILGDLSFFYDMNALGIPHKNNIRIILLNNSGAGEFYFTLGKEKIDTIDRHIGVKNNRTAEGWVKSLGYDYYSINSIDDMKNILGKLTTKSSKPIFVESFLDVEKDTEVTRTFYEKYKFTSNISIVKNVIKGTIGDRNYNRLKDFYHNLKNDD